MKWTWLALAIVVVVRAVPTQAQAPTPLAPKAVADSFFAAVRAERWASAAAYLDMDAFARLLRERVNMARMTRAEPPISVETLMAQDSTMPRAVAEWQVAKMRRYDANRPPDDFSQDFIGITSLRALEALTPADGAVRWLEAQDPNASLRRAVAKLNCPQVSADSLRTLSLFTRAVLAAVEVNDSTAYVLTSIDVFGNAMDGDDTPPPDLVLLRRKAGAWRVVPSPWLMKGMNMGFGYPRCAPRNEH
ncbi:hypothetical protein [Gemmatimonas groenlandica]|uniref:Uncharacterized protein n=1 Tax=Gemmatimonas groenlandica TaxID=2732249 RepID=A0A6M4ITT6_9BACT|nr:hypothetical protein [Gemmatimonas groenlandica]QJR37538.1 hypothetical protein HKW67_19470 [Gemmatimonas groenlandica]